MARRNDDSGAGAAIFGLILLVWFVTTFFWWIVAAVTAIAGFYLARAIVRWNREQRALNAAWCAQVAARADQQHNWVLQGDERGIYGPEGAGLMRYIRG